MREVHTVQAWNGRWKAWAEDSCRYAWGETAIEARKNFLRQESERRKKGGGHA